MPASRRVLPGQASGCALTITFMAPWRYSVTSRERWRAIGRKPIICSTWPSACGCEVAYSMNSMPSRPSGLLGSGLGSSTGVDSGKVRAEKAPVVSRARAGAAHAWCGRRVACINHPRFMGTHPRMAARHNFPRADACGARARHVFQLRAAGAAGTGSRQGNGAASTSSTTKSAVPSTRGAARSSNRRRA